MFLFVTTFYVFIYVRNFTVMHYLMMQVTPACSFSNPRDMYHDSLVFVPAWSLIQRTNFCLFIRFAMHL